ncbi:MAG: RNA polymerase sigma factor [Rhizobiaceae bacterium]
MAMMLETRDTSDFELVGRARDGDGDAFGELVGRHYDFIHAIAWRWCGNRADAEDVAQDVCVRLAKAIRGYKGGGAFTTWLYAVTLNAVRDRKRKEGRDAARTDAFGVHTLVAGQGDRGDPEADAERLWAAVRELPDKQRDAVLLVYGEGQSHGAASEVMGISESTVSWHIHEAKKRLRQILTAAGDD